MKSTQSVTPLLNALRKSLGTQPRCSPDSLGIGNQFNAKRRVFAFFGNTVKTGFPSATSAIAAPSHPALPFATTGPALPTFFLPQSGSAKRFKNFCCPLWYSHSRERCQNTQRVWTHSFATRSPLGKSRKLSVPQFPQVGIMLMEYK